jgi:hypothetical protein
MSERSRKPEVSQDGSFEAVKSVSGKSADSGQPIFEGAEKN